MLPQLAMSRKNLPKLKEPQVKQLLLDVENTGKSRQEVILHYICDDCERFYGDPASDLRRAYQKKWQYFKKLETQAYVSLLLKFGVKPGAGTQREQEIAEEQASDIDLSSILDDLSLQGDPSTPPRTTAFQSPASQSSQRTTRTTFFQSPASQSSQRQTHTPPPHPPTMSDPSFKSDHQAGGQSGGGIPDSIGQAGGQSGGGIPDSIGQSGGGIPGSIGPDSKEPAVSTLFPTSCGSEGVPGGEGTKSKPFTIQVNTAYPERNREFDIERIGNMEDRSYSRDGFHIRTRSIPIADEPYWEATIPEGYEGLKNRVVLIKGPSKDYWLSKTETYHSSKISSSCAGTKIAHNATQIAIKDNEDRKFIYFLLVFPKDIILDNTIFSNDDTVVKKGVAPMQVEKDETLGRKIYGLSVFWRIAVKHGGRRVKDAEEEEIDIKKLFT